MSNKDKKPLTEIADPTLEGAEVVPTDNGLSQRLADVESAGGNYAAFNDSGDHPTYALGKYQFVPSYHWKDIKKVTGVKNWNEFLHKPQAQEDFFTWHTEHNLKPDVERIRQYNKDGYSEDQLARLVHFKGRGGAEKWLQGHVDDTHENNMDIEAYLGKPAGKSGLKEIPADEFEGAVEVPAAGQTQQPVTEQTVLNSVFGTDINGNPIVSSQPQQAPAPAGEQQPQPPVSQNPWENPQATIDMPAAQGVTVGVTGKADISQHKPAPRPRTADDYKQDLADATDYVAQYIIKNQQAMPASYAENLRTVPFKEPGSIVNDVTDPHGDPEISSGFLKATLAGMSKDYKTALAREQNALRNDPGADPHMAGTATAEHFAAIQKMTSSIDHILDLQLANRAQAKNNYDAVLLGMEKQRLMGNKRAEQDEMDYRNKKELDPNVKMGYQLMGLNILQNAKNTTQAHGQDAIAAKFGEHSDNVEDRLKKDNPEVFRQEAIRQIANEIYKNENPIYGTVFSRQSISQEELEAAAKKLGLSKKEIANISPDEIPRSAGLLNQMGQGFINTLGAPLYEGGMRVLAKAGIANQDAVNKRFRPGWEEDNAFGHLFSGHTPTAQHEISMSNPRGVAGMMFKGVGDLGGFLLTAEAGAGILKNTGLVKDAIKANKMANFATAALPSYNAAYQRSIQEFGDAPEDESKRQLYSIIGGIVGGTVMMIDPKADLARSILGETKAGMDVIKLIKDKELSDLTKTELQSKITEVIKETTKHLGLQTSIPAIQTAAGNITDMIMDPTHDHKLMDNVGQAAVGGAVGMFLPSLFHGLRAPVNQTNMNKALLWEVGTNSRKYRDEITALYKAGDMPKDQALQTIANINKAAGIIKSQLPMASITGKELTPGQKQEYAWSLLKTDNLQTELERVEPTKDKAQIDEVKSMISAEEKLRTDILAKAGEAKAVVRPSLKVTTEPSLSQKTNVPKEKSPEQIAREVVQEVVEENKKKNNAESEENVSLSSETITDKNSSHGRENETDNQERERQDSSEISETTGKQADSEVRETTSREVPREREDRLLEPDDTNAKGGAEKQPPLAVSTKKKRRFVNEEGAPAPEKKATVPVEVTPVTGEREQAHTKGVFQDETGTLYKSTETAKGTTNEHEILSELQDLDNVVRVGAKEKTSEGEAFPVEELTPIKEGDKITLDEAREVISTMEEMDQRGVYAGELELGRDADGKLKIFDLSTAEKRDDTQTDQNYSTAENNSSRISSHLNEADANTLRQENVAKIQSAERAMLHDALEFELDAANPKSISGKKLTPLPKTKATSNKTAMKQTREMDQWLLDNAKAEVKGNDYLETLVNAVKPTGKSKMLTTADREMLNDLLFGNADGVKIKYEGTSKTESHASTQGTERLKESNAEGRVEEHARTEQTGREEKATEAKDSDSLQRSERGQKEEKVAEPETLESLKAQMEVASKEMDAANEKAYKKNTPENRKQFADAYRKVWDLADKIEAIEGERPPIPESNVKAKKKPKRKETEYQRRKREATASEPMTFREAVLQLIVSGERVSYEDIQHDLGYRASDMKAYIRRLAKNGTSVDHFIERYLKDDSEGIGGHAWLVDDAIDARREFMDIWQDYAHDENRAMTELERVQGRDFENWEGSHSYPLVEEMAAASQHDIDSFLEHGDFEARKAGEEEIQDAKLTDSDSDNIISYLSTHVSDGVVDGERAFDVTSPEFAEMYKNLSPGGRKLIDSLVTERDTQGWIELSPEQRENYSKLQTEANERSTKQRDVASSSEETAEGSASQDASEVGVRQQVIQNRGAQKPVPERTVKDIDLDLQVQRQSQKIEAKKRTDAEKLRDIPAANKANDNWHKKQAKIDRLEEERAALLKQQADAEREESIKGSFNRAADWIEKTYARNKKEHEGIVTSNMFGLTHKLTEPISDFIVARVAEGVRELGNLAVAVDRAIRMAKAKFGDEAKELSAEKDAAKIAQTIGIDVPPQERPPVLNLTNEEIAKDILGDIRAGHTTYADEVAQIMADADLSDKTKASIRNFLDWHLKDQDRHNTQTLREPDYGNKYLGDYSLSGSGEVSTYLSGKTLADVHGQEVQFDLDSKETQLQKNIVQDTANMIGLAKKHTGSDDPLVYGADMLHQINRIPDGGENSVKKVLAISGLNNELHAERIRLENELQNPTKGDGFIVQDKNEIQKRLRDLNRMIAQVELKYRDITSNASDVLNAARANRIFRNTYFHDLYADKILSEQQQREKQRTEEALVKTEVDDAIAEEGPTRSTEEAERAVEEIVQDRERSEAGKEVAHDITGKKDKRLPRKQKKKAKSFAKKIQEAITGKGKKEGSESERVEDTRKEIVNKETAVKKAEEYLGGQTPEDLFNKAKEQTKKPC